LEHKRAISRIGEILAIDHLTDIAFEVTNELEPRFSFDVFDVSESQIIFQSEHERLSGRSFYLFFIVGGMGSPPDSL
jgi:hypothetical protein